MGEADFVWSQEEKLGWQGERHEGLWCDEGGAKESRVGLDTAYV